MVRGLLVEIPTYAFAWLMHSSEVTSSYVFLLYTFLIHKGKKDRGVCYEMTAEGVLGQKRIRKARATFVQDLSKGLEPKMLFIYVVIYF